MKRIKTVNGYAIYQAVTARDEENYGCQIGSFNLYLSSDIKDYGLSYSSPMFDDIDSLASAIELANGSNFAQAEALAWELSDSTCQDMDLTLEIERRLDAGETVDAIREAYDTEEQRFVDPSTPEEPEREEISYPQILEERIAALNAQIKDCRDDDERIAMYQKREDLEEELRFAWAELEEEANKPVDSHFLFNRVSALDFAAENGNEQAASLLLLAGPDYYDGSDYDELLALLKTSETK